MPPGQRRWTIAIRILLVIPQFIVLVFVGIGAFFVAICAWFAALVTGRVPEGMASFLTFYVCWSVRVSAYLNLLTDTYPPFSGEDDPAYPVGPAFPQRGPLNRLAVLFRLILVIPAGFIQAFIGAGLGALLLFFWIAALVLGRLPDPLYRAIGTYVRFNARTTSYLFMLTGEYPWGWKGELDGLSGVAPGVATDVATGAATGQDYWAPVSSVTADAVPDVVTRFDFRLAGWSMAWIWIFLVIGVIFDLFYRR
jgi:hypothetical protein